VPSASAPAWDFDFADDFLFADGLETVLLLRQTSAGQYAAGVEVRAVRESPDRSKVAGLMEAATLVWHLHGPDVGAEGVRPEDRIQDFAGAQWNVKDASLAGVADQWRCPSLMVPA
jgi:hypothetical protein